MKANITSPKEAIARSISHNEIAVLTSDDLSATLEQIENDENVTELDHVKTSRYDASEERDMPMLDVWGKRLGEDFRLYIRA